MLIGYEKEIADEARQESSIEARQGPSHSREGLTHCSAVCVCVWDGTCECGARVGVRISRAIQQQFQLERDASKKFTFCMLQGWREGDARGEKTQRAR